ncbi:MAG: DNA polymerase IV [bacterium]
MILHIDMDAFYASVEEREQPELKGRPLIVGGRPEGRGVVAAANYAARAFGVRSAMPSSRAIRLCPQLIILRPRGELYSQVSKQIREIFKRYTPLIEPLSLDEAFLDIEGSEKLYGSAELIGRRIKDEIKAELDLIASVGVAPNKFLAKLASDHDKPDGFTVVHQHEVQTFLDPLPVGRIWGVGKVAQRRLTDLGIHSVKDMRQTSLEFLVQEFGSIGTRLWQLSVGKDQRMVVTDSEAKSISHETTFGVDITDLDTLESVALSLTEGVGFRLRDAGLMAKTVILKVRFHDFSTVSRSKTLDNSTDGTLEIWGTLRGLILDLLNKRSFSVRLIGVGVSNFGGDAIQTKGAAMQSDLFAQSTPIAQKGTKQDRIDRLSDEIRRKYGKNTIRRGKSL